MVNLLWLDSYHDLHQAGIALERRGMQVNPVQKVPDPRQTVLGVFNGHAADDAVNLIAFFQSNSDR